MEPLDFLNAHPLPFAEMLGIKWVSADKDSVTAEMMVTEAHCTLGARIHGGAVMAFADTLGAAGTILNLPDGAMTTTLESKTNFVAPAAAGTIVTGKTEPVHRGRRTHIWQTRITNDAGKLVAQVTQTQMILTG